MLLPTILFSGDELRPTKVDESFAKQAEALSRLGFPIWVLNPLTNRILTKGEATEGRTVIFRGWMMKLPEYSSFTETCDEAGVRLLVDANAYSAAHHISGWLDLVRNLTPETVLLPPDANIAQELTKLAWPSFFIKDFVKSLKTARGSVAHSPGDAVSLVAEMLKYREEIEGGFAIRKVEEFEPESEVRLFVLEGTPYSPSPSVPIPEIVRDVAQRFTLSPFYSVDIVRTRQGSERVVEIGDGQVSDLVGWDEDRFAEVLAGHWN